MKLYQAGYFRLGGRGSGSGWNIVAPSAGMSQIAKAGFRGIAARLVDVRQTMQMPPEVMGIFGHDRFIYLIHVNYAASGEDSRGVAYVHGYCFNQAEYYELAMQPEMLFGVLKESFDMEYRPDLSAYPVAESLPYRSMNERKLLDRYRISREQYKNLILGAICALEGCSGPLCIKCTVPPEQSVQLYRDVMYLIMKGLPYHLRQKLMSFSWQGVQTMVYFADAVSGDCFADLDTGKFRCDLSRLGGYQFTRLYNMDFFYSSWEMREQIFQNIAQFIGEAFADPVKDAGCALIEAGFQKKIKKNDGGIEPEAAVGLLEEFFKFELHYGTEAAEYLAALLEAVNQNGVQIMDGKLISQMEAVYEKCMAQAASDVMRTDGAAALAQSNWMAAAGRAQTGRGVTAAGRVQTGRGVTAAGRTQPGRGMTTAGVRSDWGMTAAGVQSDWGLAADGIDPDSVLPEQMAWFYARRILEQKKEKGFEILLKLKNSHAHDLYPSVCRYLEQMDAGFFADYFWNRFLPGELTSLKKAEIFLKKNGKEFSAQEQRSFRKILKTLTENEMKQAGSFEELCMTAEFIERMRWNVPYLDRDEQLLEDTYLMLWNCFDTGWFEAENIKLYKQYRVQKLAQDTGQRACPNAKKVSRMVSLLEEISKCTDACRMWDLLFAGQQLDEQKDAKLKRNIQRGFRKEFLSEAERGTVWELDVSLLLFYDAEKKQFDLVKWISHWAEHMKMGAFGALLPEYVKESGLLADYRHRQNVIRCLEETLKSKKQTAYGRMAEGQKKALQLFYSELKHAGGIENTKQVFVYFLHREVLGFFALLSLGICEICLWRYGSGDMHQPVVLAVFSGISLFAALLIKAAAAWNRRTADKNSASMPASDSARLSAGPSAAGSPLAGSSFLAKCVYVILPLVLLASAAAGYLLDGFLIKVVCMMAFLTLAAVMAAVSGLLMKEQADNKETGRYSL